ncbi:MAG TPA: SlyX family protein [Candidatus Didemnitutus sp.]|nr:SlyX family protein [Candidatus Didemnitutus sp.]
MTAAERLTRIEERYAHLQRHATEQDKVMMELGEEIARLKKELAVLRGQLPSPSGGGEDNAAHERPPHY